MAKILHLVLIAALVLAFAQSPFQHRHKSDLHHRHAKGYVHAHLPEANHSRGPALARVSPGSDAHLLDWLAGDGGSLVKSVPDLPSELVAMVRAISDGVAGQPVCRNHDPPRTSSLSSRAPPC